MTIVAAIFIILHLVSTALAAFSVHRLFRYIRKYRFDESKYTLLFGFIHLRAVAFVYVVLAILWIPMSYFIFSRYA